MQMIKMQMVYNTERTCIKRCMWKKNERKDVKTETATPWRAILLRTHEYKETRPKGCTSRCQTKASKSNIGRTTILRALNTLICKEVSPGGWCGRKGAPHEQSVAPRTAMSIRCRRKNCERGSRVASSSLWPPGPHTPRVSIVTGMNMCKWMKLEYLMLLQTSASDAAALAKTDVLDRCEGASVFGHVKSQSIERPPNQGTRVVPSGIFAIPNKQPRRLKDGRHSDAAECLCRDVIDRMMARGWGWLTHCQQWYFSSQEREHDWFS